MSEMWQSIWWGAGFSVLGGFVVALCNYLFKKRWTIWTRNQQLKKWQDDSAIFDFSTYLIANPHMIGVVRSNYRWKLIQTSIAYVAQSIFIFLFANFLAPLLATGPGLAVAQPWASWVILAIAFLGPAPFHIPKAMKVISRNRVLAAYIDRGYPSSTDLTDEIWRRYKPQ